MRVSQVRKSGFYSSSVAAILILLLACLTGLAQDNKDNRKKNAEPSKKTLPKRRQDQGSRQKAPPPQPQATRQAQKNQERRPASSPSTQNPSQTEKNQSRGQVGSQPSRGQTEKRPSPEIKGQVNRSQPAGKPGDRPLEQNKQQRQPQSGGGSVGRPQPTQERSHQNQPVRSTGGQPGGSAKPQVVRYSNGQPHTIRMTDGGMVRRSETGRVVEVHTPGGVVIHHQPAGVHRVEVVRPGNRVVVTTGHAHGYVQRPLVLANHTWVQRTYLARGVTYVRVYRPVTYRGILLNVYVPVHYFRPAFYVWTFDPWPRPIAYRWGWMHRPWYGFYGGYFVPYRSYASPTLWLTDFLIAATLEAAYEERRAAATPLPPAYPPMTQPALTPEVKQLIADEVRRQIDLERTQSQNVNAAANSAGEVPSLFADNARHTFVVSDTLLVNSGREACMLSEGSVVQTLRAPPMDSPTADAIVLASKPQECRQGAVVSIQISDLQEMENHMRETIGQGLGELQARGGQEGLPAPPPNTAGSTDAPFAGQVRPDTNVSDELARAGQEADRAEQRVIEQSESVATGTGAAPITISLGQTIDQVVANLGQPQKIVDLGDKKMYVYPDLKITFIDERVADVQ